MHLRWVAGVDHVYCCFHDSGDRCQCRKPRPGLLEQAAREHEIDLGASLVFGDRASDLAAAEAAGCLFVQIVDGAQDTWSDPRTYMVSSSLQEAVTRIVAKEGSGL